MLSSFIVEVSHYFSPYLEITYVMALNKNTFQHKNKNDGPFGL
jgi:hypothetical protein